VITRDEQNAVFAKACCGNAVALGFILEYFAICDAWDDLIDKDKPMLEWDINHAFYRALVTLPRNPFYQANFAALNPIIEIGIQNWWLANQLERQPDGQLRQTANTLRCRVFDLVIKCAAIIGGIEHAHDIAPKVAAVCYDESIEENGVK
jgi:hypothetical protein